MNMSVPDSVKNEKGNGILFLREFNIHARWEGRNKEKRINWRKHWDILITYISMGLPITGSAISSMKLLFVQIVFVEYTKLSP